MADGGEKGNREREREREREIWRLGERKGTEKQRLERWGEGAVTVLCNSITAKMQEVGLRDQGPNPTTVTRPPQ